MTEGLFSTIIGKHQIPRKKILLGDNSHCADSSVTSNSGGSFGTPEDGSRTKRDKSAEGAELIEPSVRVVSRH